VRDHGACDAAREACKRRVRVRKSAYFVPGITDPNTSLKEPSFCGALKARDRVLPSLIKTILESPARNVRLVAPSICRPRPSTKRRVHGKTGMPPDRAAAVARGGAPLGKADGGVPGWGAHWLATASTSSSSKSNPTCQVSGVRLFLTPYSLWLDRFGKRGILWEFPSADFF